MTTRDQLRSFDELDLDDLRYTRNLLRRELTQAAHWRRLVQARIDLSAAQAVTPTPLGVALSEFLVDTPIALPSPLESLSDRLVKDVHGVFPSDLPHLRKLNIQLEKYEHDVRVQLMAITDELVTRITIPHAPIL
ncbi:RsiG family protein [Timonella sp. A28]|uniref:RsiG family protein n=1 Tax=Timonella sp. A28 TaxID=3442640 RepID=UPI003EBD46AB